MTVSESAAAAPAPAPARRGRPGYDRAQVLEVAVGLFIEQGYDATSVSDLAARLGLTKSALYHHFSSKEELLALALDAALSALEAVLQDPRATQGSPSDRLGFVVRNAIDVLIDHLPQVTLLLRVRGNSPTELDAMRRRRVFDHRVTELVGEAQAEGAVRVDVDASTATRLIFGMMNSVVEWYRPGKAIDRERVAHDIFAIAMDGLRARERPNTSPDTPLR